MEKGTAKQLTFVGLAEPVSSTSDIATATAGGLANRTCFLSATATYRDNGSGDEKEQLIPEPAPQTTHACPTLPGLADHDAQHQFAAQVIEMERDRVISWVCERIPDCYYRAHSTKNAPERKSGAQSLLNNMSVKLIPMHPMEIGLRRRLNSSSPNCPRRQLQNVLTVLFVDRRKNRMEKMQYCAY